MSDTADIPTSSAPVVKPGGTQKLTRSQAARLAALARWGKYKAKPKAPAAGKKGRKAAKTPEQREAERRQAAQDNRAKVMETFGAFGRDTLPDMEALASGKEIESSRADGMIQSGLAQRLSNGSVVLTGHGRTLYNAAGRGDVGAAKEAIDRAESEVGDRQAKDKAKADKKAEADKAKAEKEKKGGGGKGGKEKPKPGEDDKAKEKQAAREKTAADTAAQTTGAGRIRPAEVDALRRAATGGKVNEDEIDGLAQLGFVVATGDNQFEASDQGRAALTALERGNLSQYQAAVQNARGRLDRESAAGQRKQAAADAKAERERKTSEREAAATERKRKMTRSEALRALGDTQKALVTAMDSAGGYLVGPLGRRRRKKHAA